MTDIQIRFKNLLDTIITQVSTQSTLPMISLLLPTLKSILNTITLSDEQILQFTTKLKLLIHEIEVGEGVNYELDTGE
jgi:hypothetical protein